MHEVVHLRSVGLDDEVVLARDDVRRGDAVERGDVVASLLGVSRVDLHHNERPSHGSTFHGSEQKPSPIAGRRRCRRPNGLGVADPKRSVERPADPPARCPVCTAAYDSVSRHAERDGLVVNLRANERYARVCFDPVTVDGGARVDFYHHTHEQAGRARDAPESAVVPAAAGEGEWDADDGGQ